MDIECIKFAKNIFVYKIPPRQSNRAYKATEWGLENPFWSGRIKIVALNEKLVIKLEDVESNKLFAKCPVDCYPGSAVESVQDSSRYYVLTITSDHGQKAYLGIGFADRSDSFDFNACLLDFFKKAESYKNMDNENAPKLDFSLKEGQKIHINIKPKDKNENIQNNAEINVGMLDGRILPPPETQKKDWTEF